MTDYLQVHRQNDINLCFSNSDLPIILLSTIKYINDEIILAQQIKNGTYSGDIIYKVCDIDTNLYNRELNGLDSKVLKKICHQVICLQQKGFPNK